MSAVTVLTEAAKWGSRILRVLPEFASLWQALESKEEAQTLDALLAFREKVSDEQMRESLERA